MCQFDWSVVIPMANEERVFDLFISRTTDLLNHMNSGKVYIVVDSASKDNTLFLSQALSLRDPRFVTIWAPENRSVVDAYLRGYREAFEQGHALIIEMDSGLSHDPHAIPRFLQALSEGNECAFGSRFIDGGSMAGSPSSRRILSRGGTLLANLLLGSHMFDMTSGYQGFHSHIVGKLLRHEFLSTGHFFQTEVRYVLRNKGYVEIPINYKTSSPFVSVSSISNAVYALFYLFSKKIFGRPITID